MSAPVDRFCISVPASSANLGPGFDSVAAALDLRMRAVVQPAESFSLSFDPYGEKPTHDGLRMLLLRAMREVDDALPAVRVRVQNEIPLGKGLGSSAAAIALGAAIAMRVRGAFSARAAARIACSMEGHPDNALAAVFGGIVVAASSEQFIRFPAPALLRPLLVVPEIELDTNSARLLLPPSYERAEVVFTAQRAALLGAALARGERQALREAMRDCMHQPHRAMYIPGLEAALAVRNSAIAGIALSGAGPSVIALLDANRGHERAAATIEAAFAHSGVRSRALWLRFSAGGLRIRPLAKEAARAA